MSIDTLFSNFKRVIHLGTNCGSLLDQSLAFLTSDDFIRSNLPFCSNDLMISSEHKNSR